VVPSNAREKRQYRCTTTIHPEYNCWKKILENLLPIMTFGAHKLVHSEPFLDYRYEIWHLLSALCSDVWIFGLWVKTIPAVCRYAAILPVTRSSADADNLRDAFKGQSRSTNMVPLWVHCDFLLSMWSAPRTTDSLRQFHSSSVLLHSSDATGLYILCHYLTN